MTNLITGTEIFSRALLNKADERNLKNSTYDLTIGDIFALGPKNVKKQRRKGPYQRYFIEPQEMVFVLSKEHFELPEDVTGVATLRTTYTKRGLLALNVGIIDPAFSGPISTALLNFSNRPAEIHVGQKFFRVLFFQHDDVSDFHPPQDEGVDEQEYIHELGRKAFRDFPSTYLNIPSSGAESLYRNFWKSLWYGLTYNKLVLFIVFLILVPAIWSTFTDLTFLEAFNQFQYVSQFIFLERESNRGSRRVFCSTIRHLFQACSFVSGMRSAFGI